MKIISIKVQSQYQIVDENKKYLASIYPDENGKTFIGDLYDEEIGGVFCKFHSHSIDNVIMAIAKYNQISISESDILFKN